MPLLLNLISLSLFGLWFHLGFIIITNYGNDVPITVTGQLFRMGAFIVIIMLAGFLWEMAGKIRKERKAGIFGFDEGCCQQYRRYVWRTLPAKAQHGEHRQRYGDRHHRRHFSCCVCNAKRVRLLR